MENEAVWVSFFDCDSVVAFEAINIDGHRVKHPRIVEVLLPSELSLLQNILHDFFKI